ncbi:MAG: ADP-forming succinate--CoA ligase subunit beta [Methanomicrobiales archaeon]|nr:ADP-forming succinate--CoA ligase subunit beta [Methanomicrobiales archaeon]MDI6875677.1 ADP-forming succinate--CoA ligase subunit beta [Methanomicrobiales archaeon]
MKLMEHEAKEIFRAYGIPVPKGILVRSPDEVGEHLDAIGSPVVLKAQVEVAGRGKAGGILMADRENAVETAAELFSREIKGLPVRTVLMEERLPIQQEYYLSITIDRSSREAVILFADSGGVDIEAVARERPDAVRRVTVSPLLTEVPAFMVRELAGRTDVRIGPVIQRLYQVFRGKDALLAEINPLVSTPGGMVAADARIVVDDNALSRQGIQVNRDLSPREREAERHGFSYVELAGSIGVIGNGAGLTMATLDLIQYFRGAAANFLDVGGGADQERVMHAVRLVASDPSVRVILVNLLGGITRCDEVARGIVEAQVPQKIMVRLAGTNEEEGRALLRQHGYEMFETMDQAVRAAVEASR